MKIDKVQSSNIQKSKHQNFRGFGIRKTASNIENIKKNSNVLPILQQAEEYLGEIGEKSSTKHFDVIIDNMSYYSTILQDAPKMHPKAGAYFGPFKFRNFKNELCYSDGSLSQLTDEKAPLDYKFYRLTENNDGTIEASKYNWDKVTFFQMPIFARLTKLIDVVSEKENTGENIFDKTTDIIIPELPKINKLMTADEIIVKYREE